MLETNLGLTRVQRHRMNPATLPIYELESALVSALRNSGRVVVQAPTGSGKSTQLPQMLWRHGFLDTGQVVVLQPRRLATRMLASRVASEIGELLGRTVGYQIRLESKVSTDTKIRFVTEGILLRQMSFDPQLRGTNVLVFDEFHERHLYGDISLARARQIQATTRPDLKIVVMSATLDVVGLADYLAPCEVLESRGRSFPVEIEYLSKTPQFDQDGVWEVATQAAVDAAARVSGDILVFMPGTFEISRTVEAMQRHRALSGFKVLPLHGELPPERQDAAVERYDSRKIIVSTNVAETSLTIDGVTVVIDAGLARVARFDARRGINTLLIEKISRASADQRAGRAGRTAPGICVRLWTERDHADRAAQELPEVHRLDLAEVVLTLKSSGVTDIDKFPWLESPNAIGLRRAEQLLCDLGALESTGKRAITGIGRKMLSYPVHPRYARMLLEAEGRGCVRGVALMAALTQGRGFLIRGVAKGVEQAREAALGDEHQSDFLLLMRAWSYADQHRYQLDVCQRIGVHAQAAKQVGPLFAQFLKIAQQEGLDVRAEDQAPDEELLKCVLAGFSDQLGIRLDRGTLRCDLVHGRRGVLARESVVQDAKLLVAGEISEIEGRGGEVNVLLTLATSIEESWLNELFPGELVEDDLVIFDPTLRRVIVNKVRRFRDLVLESKTTSAEPPQEEAARLLAAQVAAGGLKLGEWTEAVDDWIVRVNRLAEWFPELEVMPISPSDQEMLVEQICYGSFGARDLKDKPVMPVLRQWLRAEQLAVLDDYLPEKLEMPNGRKARVRYAAEGPPVLSARIQELDGLSDSFRLGVGRLTVKFEILAPNQRPIQVTDSLSDFWKTLYPQIKPELARRYHKHPWP
jgi:ATP-dependent helicase HrpB